MNLFSKTLLAGAVALMLAPQPASALPPDCSRARCDGAPCWLVCALPWSSTVITCEEWVTEYEWGTCVSDAADADEDALSSASRQEDSTASEGVCREPVLAGNAAK